MKNRIFNILLSLIIFIAPTTSAITELNGEDAEKIATLTEIYGVTIQVDKNADVLGQLTSIDAALSILGADFLKVLADKFDDNNFYLNLRPSDGTAKGYFYTSGSRYGEVELTGANSSLYRFIVVHEIGHVLQYAVRGDEPLPEPFTSEIYEGTESMTVLSVYPSRFADMYAENDEKEDYAQCFYYSVRNGGDNPIKYGADTPIYQKTLIVYEDVVRLAGIDSVAAQRIAGYLGIATP